RPAASWNGARSRLPNRCSMIPNPPSVAQRLTRRTTAALALAVGRTISPILPLHHPAAYASAGRKTAPPREPAWAIPSPRPASRAIPAKRGSPKIFWLASPQSGEAALNLLDRARREPAAGLVVLKK